jgi:hypothetical protein
MNQPRALHFLGMFSVDCPPCMLFYGKNEIDKKILFDEFFKNNEIHFFEKPKIDELTSIKSWINFIPDCKYKVIFINKVDFISKEASNFLLKIIEDSPNYVKWVLSTDSLNISGALKSRSFLVPFNESLECEEDLELIEVLKSKLYCNAYKYLLNLKQKENSDDTIKQKYLKICDNLIMFYKHDSKKINLIHKAKNVIDKNIRSETTLKTLLIQVL